jgi:prophage regulatory protein
MKKILRLPEVKNQSGYSRSSIYLLISQGLWPRPVKLGARSVGWPSDEVTILNSARISGKSDSEIRDLILQLHLARKFAMQKTEV